MKLTSFRKFAAVSAVALSVAYAGGVIAAPVQIGSPVTIPVNATVENTIDVAVTNPIDFGTVGAIRDTTDTATLSLLANGTSTEDPGNGWLGTDPAAIVFDPSDPPTTGDIDVTAAFENTTLYVTYQNCVDVALAGESFVLDAIVDDLSVPGSFDCAAARVIGNEVTSGTGTLSFQVGASITTTTISTAAYTDGAYVGSFEAVFSY